MTQWQVITLQSFIQACVEYEMACIHDKGKALQRKVEAQTAMLKAFQESSLGKEGGQ